MIRMVDTETSMTLNVSRNPQVSYVGSVWSPNGQSIATIAEGHQVHILNPKGEVTHVFDLQQIPGYAFSVSWSPDGNFLAIQAFTDTRRSNQLLNMANGNIQDVSVSACSSDAMVWATQ